MKTAAVFSIFLLAIAASTDAFSTAPTTTRDATVLMARGGRGKKKMGDVMSDNSKGMGSGASSAPGFASTNWISIPAPKWDINKAKEDKVEVFDTNLVTLKDSLTNPTGAVSVLKHKGATYCFESSCPSCKIPLSSAKVLPATSSRPTPLIACSFCKSAYNLKSGEKTEVSPEEAGGGMFAGLAQSLFKAQGNMEPLKMYQLGEKDGKILIALD